MTISDKLREYNQWRRGADMPQPDPTELGQLIEDAAGRIEELEKSSCNLAEAAQASHHFGSICTDLVSDIGNCKEVVMFGTPSEQFDAEEPRYEVKIIGPERLMKRLMDAIHGIYSGAIRI